MIKSNLRITFFLWYIKLRLKVECDNLNVKVMNMKKMELRHTKILELLTEKNKVDVTELSQNLGVSQVTIRKDLDMLEKMGYETNINFQKLLDLSKWQTTIIQGNYSGHHIHIK